MSRQAEFTTELCRFPEAERLMTNWLASLERRCLVWLAGRLPPWIRPDHLTILALLAMFVTGLSYYAAGTTPRALWLAIAGLGINWFGDSLDGTVARVRHQQRPRYGFYVDHLIDCLGASFVFGGLALSGYMSPLIAMSLLVAYLLLSIEVYLATYCLTVCRLSFWGLGPTELRLLLIAGTLALFSDPTVQLVGHRYRLFDVGGIVAMICIGVTFIISSVRNVRVLHQAERISAATAEEVP